MVDRINLLAGLVEDLSAEVGELKRSLALRDLSLAALNDASGDLVLSRYRPVLRVVEQGECCIDPGLLESVDSNVGPVVFPRFDRWIRPTIRDTGRWEPEEGAFMRSVLRQGMTVLNVGANVGYSSLVLAKAVGKSGLVISFEPEPLNFQLLCMNLRRNRATNVLPIHSAVGERTGSIRLQRSLDNTGDHRTVAHPLGIAPMDVPLVALDDLVPPDHRIAAALLDVQGYDHRVIAGMRRTIERWHPTMLVEFWPTGILEAGDDPDAVLDQYRALGYRLMLLPDHDVTGWSAEQVLTDGPLQNPDHVTLVLDPQ